MTAYIAYSKFYPIPLNTNPLEFKTTVFGGILFDSINLRDVYDYFKTSPLVKVSTTQQIAHIWGDPLVAPPVNYFQVTNTWGTTPLPPIRLKWDVFACGTDGVGGTFIGEVITPLKDISAYNTRTH